MLAIIEWLAGSWLGRAIGALLQAEIVSLVKSGIAWIKGQWAKKEKFDQIDKETDKSVENLQKAKTKEEIDSGIDDAIDRV